MAVFIAHIEAISPGGVSEWIYVSSEPVRPLSPDDPIAPNRPYRPILIEAANIRRDLFSDVTRGGGEAAFGVMRLTNADRSLDLYRDYSFGAIEVYRYEPGAFLTAAMSCFTGRVSSPVWGHAARQSPTLTLNIRDGLSLLEGDLLTASYAGTAEAGDILEGEAGLAGQFKPFIFGNLSEGHIAGRLVSAGQQIWQVGYEGIDSFDRIIDRGDDAGYAIGSDLSEADFLAASPAPATGVTHKAKGLVKLGGNPVGAVGFGVTSGTYTPRSLIKALLLRAGVPAAKIGPEFDQSGGPDIGVYFDSAVSFRQAIQFLCRAEAAAVLPDLAGVWRYEVLSDPKAVPDYTLLYDEIVALDNDGEQRSPLGRVRVGWGRNHNPLSRSEIAPAIQGTATESLMREEWRYESASDANTFAHWPDALIREVNSPLRQASDAAALAARLLSVLGPRSGGGAKETLRVVMPYHDGRAGLALGATVHVDYPPSGIDRNYLLIGAELTRPRRDQMIWRLWG